MRIFLIAIVCFIANCGSAQLDYGFMGKKNMLSIYGTGSFPVIYYGINGSYPKYYKYSNDVSVKRKTEVFDVNYRLEYTRLLNNKLAVGLEFGFSKFRTDIRGYGPFNVNYSDLPSYLADFNYVPPIVVGPEFFSLSICPTVHGLSFSKIGLSKFSFQFGIGPTFYFFNTSGSYYYTNSGLHGGGKVERMMEPKPIFGLMSFIQMTRRIPLFSNIHLDIGMRFAGEFILGLKSSSKTYKVYPDYAVTSSQARELLSRRVTPRFFSFKMGLSYQF